ncbi:MAG: HIT family protein [Oscillospiraceae bacterium]|nr:HIT family protein [Oscillospiraceae bacterium]
MADPCMYCLEADERRLALMTKISDLEVSTLHLYREQTYPGRCVLVFGRHVHKITDLSGEEAAAFFRDVHRAARALTALYRPDKINYLVLGDLSPHLHMHLVPKYAGGADWGQIFRMMPEPSQFLSPKEELAAVEAIRRALEEV